MTFALVETTKVYARITAEIEPEWLVSVAPHLCKPVYTRPEWNADSGFVYARESMISGGLTLTRGRNVHYGPIRPEEARRIFIRDAMVPGNLKTRGGWLRLHQDMLDDITGLEGDADMVDAASQSQAGVCAMHIQGTPQTMQDDPAYDNVVEDIFAYLSARRNALVASGIDRDRISLDPGIGFGKTHQHNLDLLTGCARFHELGCPVLVGHSRKGFLARILGDKEADRTHATVGVALALGLCPVVP